MRNSLMNIAGILLIVALLAGCTSTPTPAPTLTPVPATPQVIKETVIVTAEVKATDTKEVKITIEVTPVPQQVERVEIKWYIGLDAGWQPDQILLEQAFVEKYNASQTEIQLIPIIVDNKIAHDTLTAQIISGKAPDIVGPISNATRAAFPGAFLDLGPLIKEFNYDTNDINPAFLDFYKEEGKLVGLPFTIFPEIMFVNKNLFDKAKLTYPPQKYGDKYILEGTEYEWNFDTLAMIARLLTLDAGGHNATSPDFDSASIVQYGYVPQWTDHPRALGSLFEAFYPVKDGAPNIPENTIAAWKWYYDGMWGEQPFIPNQAAIDSKLLEKGNPFSSGKVAMVTTHLWYTCCIDAYYVPNWDTAPMPSYNGKVTSKMKGNTFAILADSAHPKEAFKVYTYMLGEGSADLYAIYGGLPAHLSQQADYFKSLDEKFAPLTINWQVVVDSIDFMDVPNHESGTPNASKVDDLFSALGADLRSIPDLDLDARIQQFISELQALLDEVK